MRTGPQSKLNSKIQENMENVLGSQLASLDTQLKSLSDEWKNTVRSAFSTMSSDTDSLKYGVGQRMQTLSRQIGAVEDQIRKQINGLETQSRTLGNLLATRSLTIFLSGVTLATVMSLAGAFLAVTMMINGQQQAVAPKTPVSAALSGSRSLRGTGGLGEVTMLPPAVTLVRCPIGSGSGRICIQQEEQ